MNYYPHHIGDYITATAHLTMLEDGAYRRLLDLYYSTEKQLPRDRKALYRLARARTQEEQDAVDIVVEEFFVDTDDGWFHSRCDEEIEKARVSSERSRVNGKKGGRPRKQEPADIPLGSSDTENQNPEETQQVISRLSNQNPEQTQGEPSDNLTPKPPITNSQEPITKDKAAAVIPPPESREADPPAALLEIEDVPKPQGDPVHLRAIELTALLRKRGAALQASDPRLRRWASEGVTDAQALQALELAQQRRETAGSAAPINAGYLDSILADVIAEKPATGAVQRPAIDDWYRTDAGIERKGREVGLFAHGGESYGSYRDRIWQRIRSLEIQPEATQ
ncbi:YdaU family protein [Paracandidimonas lactea]|uniref:YdaU family protein n=1 Tax=Paracandidimonas lactea TaxID=2895524 RepID=UPI001F3CCE26